MNLTDLYNAYSNKEVPPVLDEAQFLEPGMEIWERNEPWRHGIVKSVINMSPKRKEIVLVQFDDGTTQQLLADWVTTINIHEQAGGGLKIREPAQLFTKEEIEWEGYLPVKQKDKEIMEPELLVGGETAKRTAGLDQQSFDNFISKAELLTNSERHILIKKGSLGILLKSERGQMSAQCYNEKQPITGMAFAELLKGEI
jgi:hypothetical protein